MVENGSFTAENRRIFEAALLEAAKKATNLLKPQSLGVLVRKPLLDQDCPEVSDVDLISIWEKQEEMPERIALQTKQGRKFIDVLWIPAAKIFDAEEAASYKILPHLLLEYENLWMRSDAVRKVIENVKQHTYDFEVWAARIHHQINFGDAALEEAKKNLSFPAAVLFFLQTAHSYFTMALADSRKRSTMGLLTRPYTKIKQMAAETNTDLDQLMRTDLHVSDDPTNSLIALHRIFEKVSARCAGRQLRGTYMRVRGHFEYSLSPLELEYRELVARTHIQHVDFANANHYIRFWAYSLSRCPVVLEEARQGRKPSFYVPFEPLKESVLSTCPEILEDLKTIFGGEITIQEAEDAISGTVSFRKIIINLIELQGIKNLKKERSQ
jgi:hypothetical protein